MGAEKQGRLPRELCCRAEPETGELGLGKQRGEDLRTVSLAFWQVWPVILAGVPAGVGARSGGREVGRG